MNYFTLPRYLGELPRRRAMGYDVTFREFEGRHTWEGR
jgi:hypothetical protein